MPTSHTKVQSVDQIDLKKYSGIWYEVLRLPNRFEKDLKCITATYTIRKDGNITVLNKGHKLSDPAIENEAKGKAWVPDPRYPARLKVQFFWPFSGDYWILDIDPAYHFVLIGEPTLKYLWILSRTPVLDEKTIVVLLEKARGMGYDTTPVIRVQHDCK